MSKSREPTKFLLMFPNVLLMICMDRLASKNFRKIHYAREVILGPKCGYLWTSSTQEVKWFTDLDEEKSVNTVKVQVIWVDKRSLAKVVEEVVKCLEKSKSRIKSRKWK